MALTTDPIELSNSLQQGLIEGSMVCVKPGMTGKVMIVKTKGYVP